MTDIEQSRQNARSMRQTSFTKRLWSVMCFVLFANNNNAQWAVDDDGCRTPDKGTGNCIPIQQCESMLTLLRTLERPISSSVSKKLQAYTCGTGSGTKVCCPPGPIILESSTAGSGSSENKQPPDVSNHRNLYLLPKNCGTLYSGDRIVNGEDSELNEFPWMALIQYQTQRGLQFNCGGTIINKNYILTAAHCITALRSTTKLISVRVGEYSIKNETDCVEIDKISKCNPPVQDVKIERVIPHTQFGSKSFENDIGLLRVSTMNFNFENVKPICLPLGSERTKKYKAVIVTGWGVVNTDTGGTSDILQKVRLRIADTNSCASTYQTHKIRILSTQLCAGGEEKDSCPGDSGGPMMVPSVNGDFDAIYVQQGIVSFGPKSCGLPGYPGVYTLVAHYMDWILDHITE